MKKPMNKLRNFSAIVLVFVMLFSLAPSVEATSSSFEEWYSVQENRDWYHFNQWYSANERNASYYHIREHFGTGYVGDQAVKIAQCESQLNPRAKSPTNDHGVFQINYVHRRSFESNTGHTWNPNVYHASLNSKYAKDLYNRQGWGPWTCRKVL